MLGVTTSPKVVQIAGCLLAGVVPNLNLETKSLPNCMKLACCCPFSAFTCQCQRLSHLLVLH